jgi:hypothetical protein
MLRRLTSNLVFKARALVRIEWFGRDGRKGGFLRFWSGQFCVHGSSVTPASKEHRAFAAP